MVTVYNIHELNKDCDFNDMIDESHFLELALLYSQVADFAFRRTSLEGSYK